VQFVEKTAQKLLHCKPHGNRNKYAEIRKKMVSLEHVLKVKSLFIPNEMKMIEVRMLLMII
jgi:hypothetical protein